MELEVKRMTGEAWLTENQTDIDKLNKIYTLDENNLEKLTLSKHSYYILSKHDDKVSLIRDCVSDNVIVCGNKQSLNLDILFPGKYLYNIDKQSLCLVIGTDDGFIIYNSDSSIERYDSEVHLKLNITDDKHRSDFVNKSMKRDKWNDYLSKRYF